jgi:hypothetical protein
MKSSAKKPAKKPAERKPEMPLGKINYIMIFLGAAVIVLSYAGMYIEKNVDGAFALYVSPVTLLGSYAWIIFALLYRPASQKNSGGQSS